MISLKRFTYILGPILFVLVIGTLSCWLYAALALNSLPKEAKDDIEYSGRTYYISQFDSIFKTIGIKYGIDWRLLSAIARYESNFTSDAQSSGGAMGLMQVMPSIAEHFSVSKNELWDPYKNVEVAAQLLCLCMRQISTLDIETKDNTCFFLACYHCGFSRIEKAYQYALYYNETEFSWERIGFYLELLAEENLMPLDSLGVANNMVLYDAGDVTNTYVQNVMDKYLQYCKMYPLLCCNPNFD
ncbi:MAG: transglycosylase SLT domain-containing protein [Alistipes sp.]|nr:transglycosylase SLT domain-containing protein [Candidatus Alistipes equi]